MSQKADRRWLRYRGECLLSRFRWRLRSSAYRLVVSALVVCGVAGAGIDLATSSSASGAGGGGSWPTYGGNFQRSAFQPQSPRLRPLRVLWNSSKLGDMYGEPLIEGSRIYVASEADTVYALSARTGRVVWRRVVGKPVSSSVLPCGDISPTLGITSTMVLDAANQELFASAAVTSGRAVRHELVALDATTGRVIFRRSIDRPGWDGGAELQRAGLGIDAGRILIGFGGNYGDCGDYRGYLMSVPESGAGPIFRYAVPTKREGAIWAPSGETVEPSGDILLATGNSASTTSYDGGDSVIELTPEMRRVASFAPTSWRDDNRSDLDLGSSAPVLVPDNQVLIAGKSGTAYLLNASHLGGIGGQVASVSACNDRGGDAVLGNEVFLACPDSSMIALRVGERSLSILWNAPSGVLGSPTIAGGLVWSVANGELDGLTLSSGKVVVRKQSVSTENFAAPSAGDGLLVIAGSSSVEAFVGPSGYEG